MNVHHLIVTYGYAAIFIMVAIESLGVPLPGETTLIAAATYAGAEHKLTVWAIFLIAATAAIVGDSIGFGIGDFGGYRLLVRYGRYVRIDEPKIKLLRYLFDRRGGAVVFFGRFVSVLRTYAAFFAGTSRMRYPRFLFFNATGGIVWAALYTFLAYYAGDFLTKASTPFAIAAGCAAAVAIVAGILVLRHHIKPLEAKAEAAYPGPLATWHHAETVARGRRSPRRQPSEAAETEKTGKNEEAGKNEEDGVGEVAGAAREMALRHPRSDGPDGADGSGKRQALGRQAEATRAPDGG